MFERTKYLVFVFVMLSLVVMPIVAADPFGGTVTQTEVSTAVSGVADNESAQAGNVTEIVINGYSTTQSWQGYYGNVSGTIQLADGSDFVMYNWSVASPSGEVYASTNGTIQWINIQCFNFTAAGNYTGESGNGGTTSLYGTNVTQLESMFGITDTAADGVDETFVLSGAGTHDSFVVGSQAFSEGECMNTRVFDSTGAGVANNFEEVLLYEPSTASVVFTSLLENNVDAFNGKSSDFEMLVLEDGHSGNTASTPYYFFIEIQ